MRRGDVVADSGARAARICVPERGAYCCIQKDKPVAVDDQGVLLETRPCRGGRILQRRPALGRDKGVAATHVGFCGEGYDQIR